MLYAINAITYYNTQKLPELHIWRCLHWQLRRWIALIKWMIKYVTSGRLKIRKPGIWSHDVSVKSSYNREPWKIITSDKQEESTHDWEWLITPGSPAVAQTHVWWHMYTFNKGHRHLLPDSELPQGAPKCGTRMHCGHLSSTIVILLWFPCSPSCHWTAFGIINIDLFSHVFWRNFLVLSRSS